uniref:Uncharacterized protein n=1 Tax=Parascaris equorum TaxID=6256 RepID=A0A914RH17_PAREQ
MMIRPFNTEWLLLAPRWGPSTSVCSKQLASYADQPLGIVPCLDLFLFCFKAEKFPLIPLMQVKRN